MHFYCVFGVLFLVLVRSESHVNSKELELKNNDDNFVDKRVETAKWSMDRQTEDILRSVKNAQGLGTSRTRRSRIQEKRLFNDKKGVDRLLSVQPLFPLCEHAVDVKTVSVDHLTYAICLSATSQATLGLITEKWEPIHTWLIGASQVAEIFVYNRIIYVLIANSENHDGAKLLRYDLNEGVVLIDHIVNSQYPTTLALWETKIMRSNYQLAIVNSDGIHLRQNISIYEWKSTYFDRYYSLIGYDVRDVEPFKIRGQEFLAVSNHRSATGRLNGDSEIFVYDVNKPGWRSFQRIRTRGAVDMEFFSIGEGRHKDYFLAVANQYEIRDWVRQYDVDAIIYKYSIDRFVPFQCLKTSGITKFTAWYEPQFLLAVTNLFGPVQLYQYNGWNFVATENQYTRQGMGPGALRASFHHLTNPKGLVEELRLVVSNPLKTVEPIVFSVKFVRENQLAAWYDRSLAWCNTAHSRLNSTRLAELQDRTRQTFLIDQKEPIVLQGDILFESDVTVTGILTTPRLEDAAHNAVFDHSILNRLEEFHSRLDGLKDRLRKLHGIINIAMKTTGPQIVTGKHTYTSSSIDCGIEGCNIATVNANHLNNDDVSELSKRVVMLDRDVEISELEFESLHVGGDVTTVGTIGGVNVSHMVTLNGHHRITAPKIFNSVLANDVIVNGTMGGVRLSPNAVLLNHGEQTVTGEITIDKIDVESLMVDGDINGIVLNEFYKDVVSIGKRNVIIASKIVNGDVSLDELNLQPGGRINGIALDDLWANAIWKNDDNEQAIDVPINFSNLRLVSPSVSNINGISLEGPEVLLLNRDSVIKSPTTFIASKNFIDHLHVAGELNGIKAVPGNPDWKDQLDILVKSRPQTISGTKRFSTLTLSGESQVNGLFGGVDVAELASKVINRNISQNLTGDEWVFNRVEFRGPVEVHGVVHGLEVQELYDRALRVEQPLPESATVVFDGLVTVDNVESNDINGIDVSKDLVRRDADSTISGLKTFGSVILTRDSTLGGLVNSVPLQFLDDTLLTIEDQHITSNLVIEGDLIVTDLTIGGVLNGVPVSEALLIDREEFVYGPVEFSDGVEVTNGINAVALQVAGRTNGVELIEIIEDTLLYSRQQHVTGELTIEGDINTLPGTDLAAHSVSGQSLGDLARDAVYYDEPRHITGRKTIVANNTIIENLFLLGSVDGVRALDITENWMLQDEKQIIVGNVQFEDDVIVHNNIVAHTVNGIDITQLSQDVIRLDEPIELTGTFKIQTVILQQDLTLSGTIQDVDLSEEAVLKTVDNVIVGRKHFASELLIENSLEVEGLVDGVKVEDLCKKVFVNDREDFISSLTVNGNVLVETQLVSEGQVSGIDLVYVNKTLVRIDQGAVIDSRVVFDELYVEEEITLDGLLNGMDIQVLKDTYMSATRDQVIPEAMTFDDPVIINGNFTCESLTTIDHHIGDLNLEDLYTTVLMIEGDQIMTGTLEIHGNLHVKGDLVVGSRNVSGVMVPGALALKSQSNIIQGPLIIQNDLHVTEEIVLREGATVQGVDLSAWAQTAVFKEGKYSITGIKSFEKLTVNHVRANRLFGGVEISASTLLLTEGNQTILNTLHLGQSLYAKGDVKVDGRVNGIDLTELRDSAVLRNYPNTIKGHKIFQSDLRIKHMVSQGQVDMVNLSVLTQQMEEPTWLRQLEQESTRRQFQIDSFRGIVEEPAFALMYYEEVQRTTTSEILSITSGTTNDNRHFLFMADSKSHVTNGCIPISVLVYNEDREIFVPFTTFPSGLSVAMDTFHISDLYVVLANVRPMLGCNLRKAGGLQIYRWNNLTFELVESLKQDEMVLDVATLRVRIPTFAACIMATFAHRVEVLCSLGDNHPFQLIQTIQSPLVRSVTSIGCMGYPMLALANPSTSSVDVYVWESTLRTFHLLQRLEAFPDSSVVFVPLSAETCLLIVGQKNARTSLIHVYSLERSTGYFNKVQTMWSSRLLALRWLPSGRSGVYLFVHCGDFITIFNWQGANGFVQFEKLDLPAESNTFHVFNHLKDPRTPHYIAASGRVCVSSVWQQQESYSIILKAVNKGC